MKFIKSDVLIGSDPEVFLFDTQRNQFVSAIDRFFGTKAAPAPMGKEGFFVQEDNVLAEFNIPPARSENEFVTNIVLGMELVKQFIPHTFELKPIGSAFMPESEMHDPRAFVFGCDPDFNAWKQGAVNPAPSDELRNGLMRSAGGHLMVGYNLVSEEVPRRAVDMNIIQHCDLYLGVPSVLMDTDVDRKKLYGKAGAFRSKSFGVEYRTLSSFWLGSQKTISWAYKNIMKAVEKAGEAEFIDVNLGKRIQAAINKNDTKIAESLIKEFNLEVC